MKKSPSGSSSTQDEANGNVLEVSARKKLLNDQPELLQQFGMDLLPVMIQVSAGWTCSLYSGQQICFLFASLDNNIFCMASRFMVPVSTALFATNVCQ